tara:strand:+ start:256 stop:450 length:195 start_codon:yes stop_codon:yes gene_type:complete
LDGDFRANVPRSGIGSVVRIDNEVEFSALEATKLMALGEVKLFGDLSSKLVKPRNRKLYAAHNF